MGSREDHLARLVRTHSTAVANYLRRRLYPLSEADLDDLVEETMIIVWRRLDDVPDDAELPWMIGVARNVLRNARRATTRRRSMEARLAAPRSDSSAEEYVVADVAIADALARLSDDDRELVLLHAWDGLDSHELARLYSVSVNAAAIRLSRAQRRFRDELEAERAP